MTCLTISREKIKILNFCNAPSEQSENTVHSDDLLNQTLKYHSRLLVGTIAVKELRIVAKNLCVSVVLRI